MESDQLQPPGIPGQNVPAAAPVYTQVTGPRKTSGMAIASLVLGIVGPISCGLTGLVGLILGIVSLVQIKQSLGRLGGKGLAVAGIIVSVIGMLIMPLVLGLMFVPAVRVARQHATAAVDMVNMQQVCVAAVSYANDNNSCLPDPDNWKDQLEEYLPGDPDMVLESPFDDVDGCGFAMNSLLIDTVEGQRAPLAMDKISDPSKTVLFFESASDSPASGGPDLLPDEPRGPEGYVIGFVDGHVEHVERDDLEDLNWSADGSGVYEFDDDDY